MKHLFLLMVMLVAFATSTTAQNQQIKKTVADGSDLNTVLADERFLLDSFKESQVFFKNSAITKAKMNYNLLFDEMMFIGDKGDTLALKNLSDIAAIVIDGQLYLYKAKRFHAVLSMDTDSEIALMVRKYIDRGTPAKYGAYGMASPTASISTYSSLSLESMGGGGGSISAPTVSTGTNSSGSSESSGGMGGSYEAGRIYSPPGDDSERSLASNSRESKMFNSSNSQQLSTSAEFRFQRREAFSLSQGNKTRTADKKGFLKMFSKYKVAIERYLEQSPVDFKKEQDLLRLYNYCIELQNESKK